MHWCGNSQTQHPSGQQCAANARSIAAGGIVEQFCQQAGAYTAGAQTAGSARSKAQCGVPSYAGVLNADYLWLILGAADYGPSECLA